MSRLRLSKRGNEVTIMNSAELWQRHQRYLCRVAALGLSLDISRMRFDDGFLERMAPSMQKAFEAMDALERGAIANPDEKRMVGHYWLRAPELAPSKEIAAEIRKTVEDVKQFAAGVHSGTFRPTSAARFGAYCPSALAARLSARCWSPTHLVILPATR